MKSLEEALSVYSLIRLWKRDACRILTRYYCQQNNREVFVDKRKTKLTDLAAAHYSEALTLDVEDIYELLVEMQQDQITCDNIDRQIKDIINNGDQQ